MKQEDKIHWIGFPGRLIPFLFCLIVLGIMATQETGKEWIFLILYLLPAFHLWKKDEKLFPEIHWESHHRNLFIIGLALLIPSVMKGNITEATIPLFSSLVLVCLPEEYYFRFYFHRVLCEFQYQSKSYFQIACIFNGVLFGACHYLFAPNLLSSATFFPALFLYIIYSRDRDLLLCTLLHWLMNIVYFQYLSRFEQFFYKF